MKTTCTLYGQGDDTQTVNIEYFGEMENGIFVVTELKVLSKITIECGDLHTDILSRIEELEGRQPGKATIQCAIENAYDKSIQRIAIMNKSNGCKFLKVA